MSKRKATAVAEATSVRRTPRDTWLTPDAEGKYTPDATITGLDLAFPASVRHLMPDPQTIPRDQKHEDLVERWFFSGLPKGTNFVARNGVDTSRALAHVKCILGSFEPKHEHKTAAVAFLLDQWFERIEVPR
jgi:hypothetical protein